MEYKEIISNEDIEKFMALAGFFHDGIIKEIHMVNSSYVDKELSMLFDFKMSARMLVQRQWNNPAAIELLIGDITRFEMGSPHEIYSASAWISTDNKSGTAQYHIDFEHGQLTCSKLWYRDVSEWLGAKARFGYASLHYPPKYTGKIINDGWVMCGNCCEAWEPENLSLIIQCPKCNEPNINPLSKESEKAKNI